MDAPKEPVNEIRGIGDNGIFEFVLRQRKSSSMKYWFAFILNLTGSLANEIKPPLWLADENDVS